MKKKKRNRKEDPLNQFIALRQPNQSSTGSVLNQENDAADLVGGRRHRGSGASSYSKSDASSADYQVECKQTSNKSMSLKLEWLSKISSEALSRGREPMLHIRFLEAPSDCSSDWVCVPADVWKRVNGESNGE